ncbi:hypothetical protein BDB01DRAFT_220391 [Pilobolus umbonatus]|nr:hypothetical protein BDB01DRAFT_220391 [Pilobolus umbonatus]
MVQYSYPEPMPSMSTPIHPSTTIDIGNTRPRRHTITRPDSAMALLSDLEDDELNEDEQQETFDRISGILNNLIQEANDAVHGVDKERVQLIKKPNLPMYNVNATNNYQRRSKTPRSATTSIILNEELSSKIPRLRKPRSSSTAHNRSMSTSSSNSSSSSTSTLVTPVTTTSLSRSPSPTQPAFKKQLFRHSFRPRSCPTIAPNRRSLTPRINNINTPNHNKRNSVSMTTDPILESFKRLDSSMALVDSLSRDLATTDAAKILQQQQQSSHDTRFTLLLLIPLLHIPHSLITMIFDFCSTTQPYSIRANNSAQQSFSISSMIFWACVFAITNLMVDQVAVTPKNWIMKTRRMSLPGSYITTTIHRSTPSTIKKEPKRTWIPLTVQQQQQFKLGGVRHQAKRRNSI